MSLISCKFKFVFQKHICWVNFNYFFYIILDCILVQVYCSEQDPIYLIHAEKFCFTIVNLEICQQNYFTKRKLMNKLGNFGWF